MKKTNYMAEYPQLEVVTTSHARKSFKKYFNPEFKKPVLIMRHHHPLKVLITWDQYSQLFLAKGEANEIQDHDEYK